MASSVCHPFEAQGSFLPLDAITTEFVERARLQGGNVARLERMKTKYEWVTETYTVETFSMQGHAFHVEEKP